MKEKQVRKQFTLLRNSKLIYFDNSASTLKPKSVVEAVNNYNSNLVANTGRGVYKLAYGVTELVEKTRATIAQFINANENEVVFTKNTTESLNLVAQSYALNNVKKDDEIIVSALEHHSNFLPWLDVAKRTGAKIIHLPLNKENKITLANFKKVLSNKTKIVALTYVSNVLGYITPLKEITTLAHGVGAVVVVDGAQAISHFSIDVQELDCDFLAFSGYKMFGPSGVGVLYGKYDLLKNMPPVQFGGGMVLDVQNNICEYKEVPHKFEAGTPPIGSIIGLLAAAQFMNKVGYNYILEKDKELNAYLLEQLSHIHEVEVYNKNNDVAIVSFNIKGVHAHDAATMYDQFNICVRAGSHCAQPLTEQLKQSATIRVSLSLYNTKKEIDKFIVATKEIIKFFNKFS